MQAVERRAAEKFRLVGYLFAADGPVRDESEHRRVLEDGATFVAADGADLVGFAMFAPLDGEAHLLEINVDPRRQGEGLARRLIDAGSDWARSKGFDAMTLTTYRDVPWNAPFYARLGFAAFEPGLDRLGLHAAITEEAASGFAAAPRIAMRKRI